MSINPHTWGESDLLKVKELSVWGFVVVVAVVVFNFFLKHFFLIRMIFAFCDHDFKYDFSELCSLILKESILRARDKIQLTEMTGNNLLSD